MGSTMTDEIVTAAFLIIFLGSAAAAVYARRQGRATLGLGIHDAMAGDIVAGIVIGALGVGGTIAVILATGAAHIDDVGLDLPQLGLGAAVFAGAALLEEVVYRSLMLTGLMVLTGRPAVALGASAAVFGIVHLTGSPDATAISVTSNALGGLMYGIAFLRTRRIWLPLGIHFSWNFVQASLLGFPTSGNTTYSGAVTHVTIGSPHWLSGGGYGPEGSVVSLLFRLAVIAMVLAVTRRAVPAGGPTLGTPPPAAGHSNLGR